MTQGTLANANQVWEIGRNSAQCGACTAALTPGAVCWAALVEIEIGTADKATSKGPMGRFARLDFCEACWNNGKRPESPAIMFSFWKATVPETETKKKIFVDDGVLMDLFNRLEERTEPLDIQFRFVLALLLMRKRLLKYEGAARSPQPVTDSPAIPARDSAEIWSMLPRGSEKAVAVINPHLTTQQIGEVSQQLSAILAEEI